MYTRKFLRTGLILRFSWRDLLGVTALATAACVMYDVLGWKEVAIPFLPLGVIGTAVAFYVGFKNNASYERLWEARRVWGAITNLSRSWAAGVLASVRDPDARRELVHRQVAFAYALHHQLRRPAPWEVESVVDLRVVCEGIRACLPCLDADLTRLLGEPEARAVRARGNPAAHLLLTQAVRLAELQATGRLDPLRQLQLAQLVTEGYSQQGAAERIKSFPYPRQFAHFSTLFVWIFIALLPFGLVGEFGRMGGALVWLTVPFAVLGGWVFRTMEVVGDSSENPFKGGINDVPMTAVCRGIEIDLREMLGEKDLPPRLEPVADILM